MPICRLCGLDFVMVTTSHLRETHGVERYEYLAMFPDAEMIDSWYREAIGTTSAESWGKLSVEEKETRLSKCIFSEEAKERRLVVIRSPGYRALASKTSMEDWARLTFEERRERAKNFHLDDQWGENNPAWAGGHTCGYGYGWEDIRYFIFVRDKWTCQRCGTREFTETNPITCHHIDYDKENIEDDNLITVCKRCNLEVNGDRSSWKDFFREKVLARRESDVLLVAGSRP